MTPQTSTGDRAGAPREADVVVIGAGQAGLAVGYHLRRTGLSFMLLDNQEGPGGAWRHGWNSLRLFSPARFSSLPGVLMEGGPDYYPTRDETVAYLAAYEARYDLPVERPVHVLAVEREDDSPDGCLVVRTDQGAWRARAVVSTTGSWARPFVPDVPGRDAFAGEQVHSSAYRSPEPYRGRRVLVVGGGNSGAQVLAEVSAVAGHAAWATLTTPTFLPDDVDGRVLFDAATDAYRARQEGRPAPPPRSLGDVVAVAPVREARDRGALVSRGPLAALDRDGAVWADGGREPFDAVIWCTGFRPSLGHLGPLGVVEADGRVRVEGTRSVIEPRLWLVGYGEWTGFASATLIGVGRSARATADEVAELLRGDGPGRGNP
ncbi:MAG TPA: ArsO family NAD(P)H-dependent flavin-containing monooxygenase [Rubricoccaceae bacterium]|jgi:cation diffusion facilitator CzcD-associated flavoprotein CzcO